jgi:hypothetical protein
MAQAAKPIERAHRLAYPVRNPKPKFEGSVPMTKARNTAILLAASAIMFSAAIGLNVWLAFH